MIDRQLDMTSEEVTRPAHGAENVGYRRQFSAGAATVAVVLSIAISAFAPAMAMSKDEAILLSTTAPDLSPGGIVRADDTISIPEAATATYLFRSGEILRIRGPFRGMLHRLDADAARNGSTNSAEALAEILRLRGIDATAIAATRGLPVGSGRQVLVDPRRDALYCLRPGDMISLRESSGDDRAVQIRPLGAASSIAPVLPAATGWPPGLAINDGDRFEIWRATGSSSIATFRRLPDASTLAERIFTYSELGCGDQAMTAIRNFARSATPPEITLTTDRGGHPVYRPGEPIRLTVRPDRDGHLYCCVRTGDGMTIPIFPADTARGSSLRGNEASSVPGEGSAIHMSAGASGEADEVVCWFADRDVDADLPAPLVARNLAPLSPALTATLDERFRALRGTAIAKAAIVLRVE